MENNRIKQAIEYYDHASASYSETRYEGKVDSYIKYLFTKRWYEMQRLLQRYFPNRSGISILEIGCADGVMFHRIKKYFPQLALRMLGLDISPKMIEVAQAHKTDEMEFFLRDGWNNGLGEKFDLVLELGVHVIDRQKELDFVKSLLKPNGYYLVTAGSKNSLYARIKLRDKDYASEMISYKDYEEIFNRNFELVHKVAYVILFPKLWKFPTLARKLQPAIDMIFRPFFPELFHEQLYLLRPKQ